jgi:putative ABC transport system permease protein
VATAAGIGALAGGLTGHGTTALYLTGAGALVIFLGITTLSPIVSKPVIAALGWPFARLFGTVGRLSRENAQRNPRRTAATASALMIGLALVGTVTVLASSITASIDAQFASGLGADYLIYAKGGSSFTPETVDAVTKVPGVRNAVPVRTTKLTLDSKKVTVTVGQGPDLVSAYALDVKDGSSTLGADEVLVTQGTAEGNGWKVGGTVPGTYADGSTAKFRIAGLYADSITGPAIILGTAGYLAHSTSRLINEIDVLANSGVNIAATKQAIQSALSSWPNLSLLDQSDIKNRAKTGVNTLLTLILVMLVLSVVIAALGVVNTLALSVIERTREIGLLRAVGMDRRNLRRMIRYEAVMIAVFGAVLGLGTGVIFGWAFQRAEAGKGLHVLAIPVGRLGLYVLAAVVIGVIAAIWPARRAAKMDILRAISTE